jgi:hypothetical protein
MKLSSVELGTVAVLIVYVAFFTHPPPSLVSSLLSSPIVKGIVLLTVLYLATGPSLIVGLFLGIAYVMTTTATLEYLDPKEQKPTASQPKASGIPPAAISGMLSAMTGKKKKDRLPQSHGKASHTKPDAPAHPKPATPVKIENFSSF